MHTFELEDATATTVVRALASYVRGVGVLGARALPALAGAGPVAELETRLTRHYGMRYAVCVSSATMGITALVHALELDGTEVVTTPISYGATVAPLLALGCSIGFADVETDTLGLDPTSVLEAINPRTSAILAVDVLGVPADTAGLREVADEAGVWYLADAAQSLGATRHGRPASSSADALVVSFGAGKTVFAGGEGGAIVTDNEEIFRRVVWWTQHPLRHSRDLGLEARNEFGLNGRMHGAAAAWANAVFGTSLERLKQHQERCFDVFGALMGAGFTVPLDWQSQAVFPSFFRLAAAWKDLPRPAELEQYLRSRGHEVTIGDLPVRLLYREAAFRARAQGSERHPCCPVAERELARHFTLELGSSS